ncbi:transcriptional regulator [Plasticicumulans acidivorans]|uniref:transcriptional regulator n=1 Tax=Plasticicumulans acidivorans TaxID=886464 RepID=UPI000D717A66|nr:YdaS family helix-turn-helix protein [Plasticicumulans acidivorans]
MNDTAALLAAIEAVKGQSGMARTLGVTVQAVRKWLVTGIPAERVLPIYRATHGTVTPHQMRPDIYPDPDWLPPLGEPAAAPRPSEAKSHAA